jgi:hypothetical protein
VKPVIADFSQHSAPSRTLWGLLGVAAALSVAAAAWTWHEWRELETQRALLRDTVARQAATPAAAPIGRAPPPYQASAREMLMERAAPWPQALTMIEATAIVGVTPAAVEFAASDKTIRLEVTFADYSKLLEYVDALNAGEPELRWSLQQSQAQAGGASSAVITASLVRR